MENNKEQKYDEQNNSDRKNEYVTDYIVFRLDEDSKELNYD